PPPPAAALVKRGCIGPDLAVVDDALVVLVHDLDRVFDRHDVLRPRAVDVIDDRREGGCLPRAGRAGDEDQPALFIGQLLDARRKAERREAGNLLRDDSKCKRDRPPLAKAVDAETGKLLLAVRSIELA